MGGGGCCHYHSDDSERRSLPFAFVFMSQCVIVFLGVPFLRVLFQSFFLLSLYLSSSSFLVFIFSFQIRSLNSFVCTFRLADLVSRRGNTEMKKAQRQRREKRDVFVQPSSVPGWLLASYNQQLLASYKKYTYQLHTVNDCWLHTKNIHINMPTIFQAPNKL